MLEPSMKEAEVLARLRRAVHEAKYPPIYYVSRDDLETIEDYYQKCQAADPEGFIHWAGPHVGTMFKGCELLEKPLVVK
jgi:hypothetical protein